MRLIFLIIAVIYFQNLFTQKGKITYFDKFDIFTRKTENAVLYIETIKDKKNKIYTVNYYHYPSNKLKMTGTYSNINPFIRNGKFKWYHKNGILEQEAEYMNDTINGYEINYYEDGKIKSKKHFSNGVIDNEYKYWHENGNLFFVFNYKNGVLHDTIKTFYPNGNLRRVEIYKYGKLLQSSCYGLNGNDTAYYPLKTTPYFLHNGKNILEYIKDSVILPKYCIAPNTIVKVGLYPIVEEDGSLTNIEILYSNKYCFKQPIKEVLFNAPKWTPSKIEGKPIVSTVVIDVYLEISE